jgi:phosphoglycolate phosphatase
MSAATVQLVVFDLDGTLIDPLDDLTTAVNATLGQLQPGRPALTRDAVRVLVGQGAAQLVARSLEHDGVPVPLARALPVFFEAYGGCLLDHTRAYPGVEPALEALHGVTLDVLTNKPGGFSRTILAGLGLARHFRRVLGGDDGPPRKPDPAGLQLLMSSAGVGPQATLLVGDSPVDVATARAAGVRVAGVTYGLDPDGLQAAAPDILLADLRELPAYVGSISMLG